MNGRDAFSRVKPAINAISAVFAVLPRFLFSFTWPVLELVPWKLGIALRYLWARRLAKSCGDNVVIETGVRVTFWEEIEIGDNVGIFETCYLDGKGGIRIGNDVSIGHQCSLVSFDFDLADRSVAFKQSRMKRRPIIIGDNCIIFSGVRIFAGANLASGVVIGANAVVRAGDYQPGLHAGIPAQFKKAL